MYTINDEQKLSILQFDKTSTTFLCFEILKKFKVATVKHKKLAKNGIISETTEKNIKGAVSAIGNRFYMYFVDSDDDRIIYSNGILEVFETSTIRDGIEKKNYLKTTDEIFK
jgi:hypothetical protein